MSKMIALLTLIVTIAIWIFVAKFTTRFYIKRGYKAWISKTISIVIGLLVALIFLISMIINQEDTINKKSTVKNESAIDSNQKSIGDSIEYDVDKEDSSVESNQTPTEDPVESDEDEPKKTLEITPEVFTKRLNARLKSLKNPFRLKIHIKNGKINDTFSHMFNDYVSIMGFVDKNSRNLSGLVLTVSNNSTELANMAIILSAYYAVLGEKIKEKEVNIIMDSLIEKMTKNPDKEKFSTIFNGIEFSISRSYGNIFCLFTIEPF